MTLNLLLKVWHDVIRKATFGKLIKLDKKIKGPLYQPRDYQSRKKM